MAAKQTRRSVSVKGITYQRVKGYCERKGLSVSGFLEELIARKLGTPTPEERRKFGEAMERRQKKSEAEDKTEAEDQTDDFNATYTPPIRTF